MDNSAGSRIVDWDSHDLVAAVARSGEEFERASHITLRRKNGVSASRIVHQTGLEGAQDRPVIRARQSPFALSEAR
jgi:hypothetical protein